MLRNQPTHGIPRLTRREALMTVFGVFIAQKSVTASAGFVVRGELAALESEKLEGYAQIGNEFGISAHPKGAAFKPLMDLVGQDVRVTVEPA